MSIESERTSPACALCAGLEVVRYANNGPRTPPFCGKCGREIDFVVVASPLTSRPFASVPHSG